MSTNKVIDGVIIGLALIFIFKILVLPLPIINSTDDRVMELNVKVADLQNQLLERPVQTQPDYRTPIVFGIIILCLTIFGTTWLIINYKQNKMDKKLR